MDPITTISGPIDAASFNNDATAIGTKVLAEITQNTTKINEIIGGLTVVASDLDVEEAARSALGVRVTDAEADIDAIQVVDADQTARIVALEANAASYGVNALISGHQALTNSMCQAWRNIYCVPVGAVTTNINVTLPYLDASDDLQASGTIKIINDGRTSVHVLYIPGTGVWGNGAPGEHYIELLDTEYVELFPMPSRVTQGDVEWFIVGGKTYADLTP